MRKFVEAASLVRGVGGVSGVGGAGEMRADVTFTLVGAPDEGNRNIRPIWPWIMDLKILAHGGRT